MLKLIKSNEKYFLWKAIILSLLAASIIQILLYLNGYYSFSGDESDRTLLAYYWLKGTTPKGEPWLPFHTIINGIALKIFLNLFWTPRIIGFIFGLFSVSTLIWLSHVLLRDKRVTILSAILGVLFPPFVILRSVPLSEIMYFLFVILGGIYLYIWFETKENKKLLVACLSFALAGSVRYEGWVFSGCLIIILLIFRFKEKEPPKSTFSISILLLLVFPLFWIFKNYLDTGNPLNFIISSSGRYKLHYGFSILPMLKYNLVTQFLYSEYSLFKFCRINFFILPPFNRQ